MSPPYLIYNSLATELEKIKIEGQSKVQEDEKRSAQLEERVSKSFWKQLQKKSLKKKKKKVGQQFSTVAYKEIEILQNSTGHSYDSLFGECFDETVTHVTVEEPWIRDPHQFDNLVRFVELCINRNSSLKSIHLETKGLTKVQEVINKAKLIRIKVTKKVKAKLQELKEELSRKGISFSWEFNPNMHDRKIQLNNGWTIKSGRGLNIYKRAKGKKDPSYSNYNLRKCKETTVDIIFQK